MSQDSASPSQVFVSFLEDLLGHSTHGCSGSPGLAGSLPIPRCWKLGQLKQAVLIRFSQHVKALYYQGFCALFWWGSGMGEVSAGDISWWTHLFKGCFKIALGRECGLKVSNHFSLLLCVRITFSSGDFRSFWFGSIKTMLAVKTMYTLLWL